MTTLTLSQTLLDTDLSSVSSTSSVLDSMSKIDNDISGLLNQTSFFDSKPLQSGKTLTYSNPTFNGSLGEYIFAGSLSMKYDNNNAFLSSSSKFTGATINTGDGHITIKGTVSSSGSVNNYSYSTKYSSFSYQGNDGNQWTLLGNVSSSYKYIYSTDTSNFAYSANFTSFTQKDTVGNSLVYSGNIKYDISRFDYTGYFTSIALTIGSIKLNATGLKISYEDFKNSQLTSVIDLMPNLLLGNDIISLSITDAPNFIDIHGYSGNDTINGSPNDDSLYGDDGNDVITGGEGDDLISGGAGSDKLTGGKGADTFSFDTEDFFTANGSNDQLIFNKSSDTILDFKLSEGDTLSFGNLGTLSFYSTLIDAKAEYSPLFYIRDSGIIYLNTDSTGDTYNITPIITLTGNPQLLAEQVNTSITPITTITKVPVIGTTTSAAPLDSKGNASIAWTESKTAGSNVFNVDSGTTTATLALTGTSGDVVNIKGYSGDYSATLSGTKLTLQSNSQTVTVTLAKASKVTFGFADGDKVVDTAAAKLGTQALSKVAMHVDGVTAHEAAALAAAKTASDAAVAAQKTADAAAAKTAQDAAVKAALTDASGKLYTTVDAAITSNDDAAIKAAVSTATGSKFTTVADLFNAYNAYATPSFSVIAGADAKEGTNASFTINLSAAQATPTSVNLGLTPVGGASAADVDLVHATLPAGFTLTNNVLTFPVGATTATLSIPVVTDTISPETGEGLTIALTPATGSTAKVSATAASGTVNFIDVPAPATPAAVNITAANNSATATAGADTFNIAPGSYTASIAGFGPNDKLVFAPGTIKGISNTSSTDGNITVNGSLNNQLVTIQLTGISTDLDVRVFDFSSFNTTFGLG